jgi:hypothetical protein
LEVLRIAVRVWHAVNAKVAEQVGKDLGYLPCHGRAGSSPYAYFTHVYNVQYKGHYILDTPGPIG